MAMLKNNLILAFFLGFLAFSTSACGIADYFNRLGERMPTYEKITRQTTTTTVSDEPAGVVKHGEPATLAKPLPTNIGQ